MIKNYLVIAIRSLIRDRFYSVLNILGFAVGLAVCLLIFLFVRDEWGYESQFRHAERIYRVGATFSTQQVHSEEARISYLAADLLQTGFPETIEETAQLVFAGGSSLFSRDDRRFYENRFYTADSAFFRLFDFTFLAGDSATALDLPNGVVLTEHVAKLFFGDENPVGQTITYDNRVELEVTGVIEDVDNTHLAIDLLASKSSLESLYGNDVVDELEGWGWPSTYTYIMLKEGADIDAIKSRIRDFEARNNVQEQLDMFFQPVSDIHLHSNLELEMQVNGNIQAVWIFSIIALLILFIASINFMNLATARSTLRAREVGIRKAVGALRTQLVFQFMGEALLMTLLAMVVGLVLLELLLPSFNAFLGKSLALDYLSDWRVPVSLLGFVALVALVSGCYPALFLSRVVPASVLPGNKSTGTASTLRNRLVIVQFSISIALLACTSVIGLQISYARTLDLGYDREAVVVVNTEDSLDEYGSYQALRQRLLQNPAVIAVSMADTVPTDPLFQGTGYRLVSQPDMEPAFLRENGVGFDFFHALQIDLVAGRTFSEEFSQDVRERLTSQKPHVVSNLIMNEAAVEKFGWESAEAALGKQLILGGSNRSVTYTVIGVVRDVQYASLDYVIEPLVYGINAGEVQRNLIVRVSARNLPETIAFIDEAWNEVVPGYPITRTFLDTKFEARMQRELRSVILMAFFAGLAVLISCIGVLGLAAFITQQRRCEIAVRKVMGGSVWQIVLLLTNDFSRLVFIANVIAWPLAWVAMSRWLEQFAYRIDLTPLVFIGSGLIALCVAWVTVGGTAARAAGRKPVLALRYE